MEVKLTWYENIFKSFIQHYNHKKYWKFRECIVSRESRCPNFLKIYKLFRIKRMDAFNNASFGTHFNYGAKFKSDPILPHGINGIIISHNAIIGKSVVIFHQVTIGEGKGGAPIIEDNVFIGAGAKIIGNVKIGNNVKIGANCIVVDDIPDNATIVLNKPRIL